MKVKIIVQNNRLTKLNIKKGNIYELSEDAPIIIDAYKIKVPKKQKGKFQYVLIRDDEGELVD